MYNIKLISRIYMYMQTRILNVLVNILDILTWKQYYPPPSPTKQQQQQQQRV